MKQGDTVTEQARPRTAVVMNMYYTGLGVARSLGEHGVPVIGLSSKAGVFGNYTRYAKVLRSPDSRAQPEELAAFLLRMARDFPQRSIIFPTRDDDLVFLDRFRGELSPHYSMVMPESAVLNVALDKWETYLAAERAGVAAPRCWKVEGLDEVKRAAGEVCYPCVLKAVAAHHWRQGANWELVGERKAIPLHTESELLEEYRAVARADRRALIQEMVPGGDECLIIAACYIDRQKRWTAGFNTQKLVQVPAGFGTGCIVQSVSRPDLFEPTARLLESMGYSGIAEVEYKWDAAAGEHKLIEINPRPWDQHRLGQACGVDLMYAAYCDHSELPFAAGEGGARGHKWIAEDTFFTTVLRRWWRRDPSAAVLFRQARGKRIYAIWSIGDPLPFLVYLAGFVFGDLVAGGVRRIWSMLRRGISGKLHRSTRGLVYESHVEK